MPAVLGIAADISYLNDNVLGRIIKVQKLAASDHQA
jgi:hypothetical protein